MDRAILAKVLMRKDKDTVYSDDDIVVDHDDTTECKHRRHVWSGMMSVMLSREVSDISGETCSTASDSSDCGFAMDEPMLAPGAVADVVAVVERPKVTFSHVSVRIYSLTVGDTFVAKPYSLMLDWKHTAAVTMDITSFEEQRSTTRSNEVRRYNRGFALPLFLPMDQRFDRLAIVTGKSLEQLYRLESRRLAREDIIPLGMCSSDEGYDDLLDDTRSQPYQYVDMDDYQMSEV